MTEHHLYPEIPLLAAARRTDPPTSHAAAKRAPVRGDKLKILKALAAGPGGQGSFKSQFKKADASGARYALVFGGDELAQGQVAVKSLRDASIAQTLRPLAEAADWATSLRA